MSDEVRILVGTLAFGLGINKPAVRAVIHLSLPKSIEQYYQEAGRAGRDGETAECALLWQKKDAGLLAYFCEQLAGREEKQRAWERYHAIRNFVTHEHCRHRQICLHFGETPKWEKCGSCDRCAELPEWMNEKKFLERLRPKKWRQDRAVDPDLMDFLREWRREFARRQNVPAFLILTDATLSDVCAKRPRAMDELTGITGIGERKAQQYGMEILRALERFQSGERAVAQKPPEELSSPAQETVKLLALGKTFEEIAQLRGRQVSTVVGLIATMVEQGKLEFRPEWIRPEFREPIETAVGELGHQWLKPLKERVPDATYDEIRLIVARLRSQALPHTINT